MKILESFRVGVLGGRVAERERERESCENERESEESERVVGLSS